MSLVRHRNPGLVSAAAGLAVAGHNWSLFQGGAGGRGILPATGILLVVAPSSAALVVGGIAVGYVAGDTAPTCFAAQLLLVPVLSAGQGRGGALLGLAMVVQMLAKRLLSNSPLTRGHLRPAYVIPMIYDCDARPIRRGGR